MKHGDATEHAIPLVSSLGFLLVFENLILIPLGSDSQRFAVPFKADVHVGGMVIGVAQLASCVLAVAVVGSTELHPEAHQGRTRAADDRGKSRHRRPCSA